MPEGHTLRKLANDLNARFQGLSLAVSSPQGRFAAEAQGLNGERLLQADAAGKHLFLDFDLDRIVHIHLGLIGKFDLYPAPEQAPQGAVRLRLSHPETGYADLRGATRCDLVGGARRAEVIAALGPDPLRADADPQRAWAKISKSSRSIGELLMDQEVIAGVGNVYRAEVLFRHRIHPLRQGRTLTRAQFMAIWQDLTQLMAQGVVSGRIDTVRPEHTPEAMGRPPRKDDHGGEVYVYRRTSMECFVCGGIVRTAELAGRNSFWCPRCQRAPRKT